jgi:hypothetical protein
MTMKIFNVVLAAAAATLIVVPRAEAQQTSNSKAPIPSAAGRDTMADSVPVVVALPSTEKIDTLRKTAATKRKSSFLSTAPGVEMQNYRPEDKRGVNVFEAPKEESVEYTGFKLQWGAAFTQQFQGLDHSNTRHHRCQ